MYVYTYIYLDLERERERERYTYIHIFRIFSFISKFHWNKAIMVRADISKVRLTATHSINSPLFLEQTSVYTTCCPKQCCFNRNSL